MKFLEKPTFFLNSSSWAMTPSSAFFLASASCPRSMTMSLTSQYSVFLALVPASRQGKRYPEMRQRKGSIEPVAVHWVTSGVHRSSGESQIRQSISNIFNLLGLSGTVQVRVKLETLRLIVALTTVTPRPDLKSPILMSYRANYGSIFGLDVLILFNKIKLGENAR